MITSIITAAKQQLQMWVNVALLHLHIRKERKIYLH